MSLDLSVQKMDPHAALAAYEAATTRPPVEVSSDLEEALEQVGKLARQALEVPESETTELTGATLRVITLLEGDTSRLDLLALFKRSFPLSSERISELFREIQEVTGAELFGGKGNHILLAKATAEKVCLELAGANGTSLPIAVQEDQARVLTSAGYVFMFLREYEQAYACHKAAYDIRYRLYGELDLDAKDFIERKQVHLDTADSMKNIGYALIGQERREEARQYFVESWANQSILEAPPLVLLDSQHGMADADVHSDPPQALKSYESVRKELSQLIEKLEGSTEPADAFQKMFANLALAICLRNIGNLHLTLGNQSVAAESLQEACERLRKDSNGGMRLYLITALVGLSKAYQVMKEEGKRCEALKEARAIVEEMFHGTPSPHSEMLAAAS